MQAPLVGVPATAQALLEPLDRVAVTPLGVAAATGGDLVLQPRRAALHPGHDVLGGRRDQPGERATAPDTGGAVPVEDLGEASGAAGQGAGHPLHRPPEIRGPPEFS